MHRYITQRGIIAIELVVGVSILVTILLFSIHAAVRFLDTGGDLAEKTQALYLASEALELVRYARDEAWANISVLSDGTTYYLDIDPSTVTIVTGTPEIIEGFTRSFTVTDVERNGSDDIVASGTADPDAKYVTATVSWAGGTESVSLTTILTDLHD